MNKLIILSCLIFLSACGSIGSRRDIVPVDSKVRGVSVFDEDHQLIGKTPFFYEMDKGLWQTFYYKKGDREESLNFLCRINWSESIIPNLIPAPFFPIGTAISAGFFAIDGTTGDAFRCKDKILIDDEFDTKSKYKRKILVLPINTDDPKDSYELIKLYVKKNQLESEVIDLAETEEVLTYFGIDGDSLKEVSSIPKDHLYEVAYRLKATHVLFLKLKDKKLIPQMRDLFSGSLTAEELKPFPVPERFFKEEGILKKVGKYFNLLPNSLTLSYLAAQSTENRFEKDAQLQKHPSTLPILFSMWGLTNIRNPRQLRPWDYEFSVGPSLEAPAFRYEHDNYWINAQRYGLMIEPSLTLHSPFGALVASIGFGPSYSYADDSDGVAYREFNLFSIKTGVNYYVFFKERYFFKVGLNSYAINDRELGDRVTNTVTQTTLSLGYYIPHLKGKLRYLMPF